MESTHRIRGVYEKRPYPFGDRRAVTERVWRLPPIDWIKTFNRCESDPASILVAGCGDGSEAFNICRRFPKARVVAVDFSDRSIALARRWQQSTPEMKNIEFIIGDLADPRLPGKLGGPFDFISCHGVLSYIPAYREVLRTLAGCLKTDGALYLGVNGSSHVSVNVRRALPGFGFDLEEFADGRRVRDVLALCDAALEPGGFPSIAKRGPGYLAGDVFGSFILNLSQAEWMEACGEAGLYLLSSCQAFRALRSVIAQGLQSLLLPRSRGEVAQLLDSLLPAQFHRLLLGRVPEPNPPWEDFRQLRRWRLKTTKLHRIEWPKPSPVRDRLRPIKFKNSAFNTLFEWRMPDWEIEMLRRGDGIATIGSLLDNLPLAVSAKALRERLYELYQLGIVNLWPPNAG